MNVGKAGFFFLKKGIRGGGGLGGEKSSFLKTDKCAGFASVGSVKLKYGGKNGEIWPPDI